MKIKAALALLIVSFILVSCSGESESAQPEEQVTERVRPTSARGTSAAYFLYKNPLNIADTLIAVQSDVSEMSQVHETFETEDGMMGMREQKNLVVPAGQNLRFEQGGLHIMLIGVQKDLKEGDSVLVQLEWANAGSVQKQLPVQAY